MEIKGQLKALQPIVERGEFKSRKVWITTDADTKYPQTVELEVSGNSIDIFDNVAIGATVVCHVNLRGREWQPAEGPAKVFNTLACWRIEVAGQTAGPAPASQQGFGSPELPEDDGKLPF